MKNFPINTSSSKDSLTPMSIITEALEIGRRLNVLKSSAENRQHNEKVYETVKNTHAVSRQCFLLNLSNRKLSEVNAFFQKEVDECNALAEKIITKNKKSALMCIKEIDIVSRENSKLDDELTKINTSCKRIDANIKKSNETISQLQTKFAFFEKVKPLLEALIKEFPNEDPLDIISEMRTAKDKNLLTIKKLNSLNDNIESLEKEKEETLVKYTKNEDEMKKKLEEANYDTQAKIAKLNKEIKELEREAQSLNTYQKENSKMNTLLYELYSGILSKIQTDKLLAAEKKFGKFRMTKENFTPEIFDSKAFIDLLSETIMKNVSKAKGASLLRQTMAFSNRIVRLFMPQKEILRFDLVNTFKEIKNLNDKQEFDIYKLKCIIQSLKESEAKNKQTIKELKNEVKLRRLKYNSLMNKVNRQLKIESNCKKIENSSEENQKKSKRVQTASTNINRRKFFITSQNAKQKKEENENKLRIKSANLSYQSESGFSEESDDEDDKTNEVKKKEKKQLKKILLNENYFKKFKDIQVSKNHDKLIKSNGFKGIGEFINGIKTIVENTNRVQYYQSKAENDLPKNFKCILSTNATKSTEDTNAALTEPKYDALSRRVFKELNELMDRVKRKEK